MISRSSHTGLISIHVPIAGNDAIRPMRHADCTIISIHVPIAGNDGGTALIVLPLGVFQSTFPLQGTTQPDGGFDGWQANFNPRSHCRERPGNMNAFRYGRSISIHVPIAGNDLNLRFAD